MRLLDSSSLLLSDHLDGHVPEYAVLSHRWRDGEISIQEWLRPDDTTRTKAGYHKIIAACRQAHDNDIKHIWIDTCCIDKTSSAELTEAINAMFDWYQEAKVCYAFIDDIDESKTTPKVALEAQFARSGWFTRGWALQELIAPRDLRFLDKSWTQFGTKTSLANLIQNITGIDLGVLDGSKSLRDFSVACRMSWASNRETTRPEGIAYSLMGIFEINMPIMYGERQRAFVRLQDEILKSSDDHSIFAWSDPAASPSDEYGLLAEHPRFFRGSRSVQPATGTSLELRLISQTSSGISIQIPVILNRHHVKGILNCSHGSESPSRICIDLRCVDVVGCQFRRVNASTLENLVDPPILSRQIFVKQRKGLVANPAQPGLDTVRLVFREHDSWEMGPWTRQAWVSPQSFLVESWQPLRAEQAFAAKTWRQVVRQAPSTYHDLKQCVFALPPFINTPAFLVSFGPRRGSPSVVANQGLVVGRASNGHVGVKTASAALLSMAYHGEIIRNDQDAGDLNPLELPAAPLVVEFDLGGVIIVGLQRHEFDDHSEYVLNFAHFKTPRDEEYVKMAIAGDLADE